MTARPENPGHSPDDGVPARAPWLGRGMAIVGLVIIASCVLWPVAAHPTSRILGLLVSEAANHVRNMSAALQQLPSDGLWLIKGHEELPPIIPANIAPAWTLLAAPFHFLAGRGISGFCLAWNAVYAVVLLGAWAGAWLFVREWLPRDPWRLAAGASAILVAASPFFLSLPEEGRIETLTQILYPLHLAFLYRAVVSRGRVRDLLAAASTFALLALEGGYPTLWLAVVEPPVALWCLYRSPRRGRGLLFLGIVASAGILAVFPYIRVLYENPPPPFLDREQVMVPIPLATLLPGGQDVLLRPEFLARPYPGIVLLLLAGAAAIRHRASRPWLGLALLLLLLVPGADLRWKLSDDPWFPLPLGCLPEFPMKWLVASSACRLGSYVPLFLALAAAPSLCMRKRGWVMGIGVPLVLAAFLDAILYRPAWSQAAWDPRPPEVVLEWMSRGPVVHAPADDQSAMWSFVYEDEVRQGSLEPDSANLPLIVFLNGLLPNSVWALAPPPTQPTAACVARDAKLLAEQGMTALALRFGLSTSHVRAAMEASLVPALGPAQAATPDLLLWSLPGKPQPEVAEMPCDPSQTLPFSLPEGEWLPGRGWGLPAASEVPQAEPESSDEQADPDEHRQRRLRSL